MGVAGYLKTSNGLKRIKNIKHKTTNFKRSKRISVMGGTFNYSSDFEVDSSKIDSDLTNYPLMVKLEQPSFNLGGFKSENGYDVKFTNKNGTVEYDYEIVYFNKNLSAVFYVKIPLISSTIKTEFKMFFGNSTITTDQSNPSSVWDDNFVAVYHLVGLNDSTGNGFNLTNYGTTLVDGLNGKARKFDGYNDWLECSSTLVDGISSITITALINIEGPGEVSWSRMVDLSNGIDSTDSIYLMWDDDDYYYGFNNTNNNNASDFVSGNPEQNTWLHWEGSVNGGNFTFHENNVSKQDFNKSFISNALKLAIGRRYDTANGVIDHFEGIINEVRISNIPRSSSWRKADYYNLKENNLVSFSTYGNWKTRINL
jgi:hypothetical protein